MRRIDARAVFARFTPAERDALAGILADIGLTLEDAPGGVLAALEAVAFARLAREEVFVYRRTIEQGIERARRHLRLSPKRWRERVVRWGGIPDAAKCGAETPTFPVNAHTRTR